MAMATTTTSRLPMPSDDGAAGILAEWRAARQLKTGDLVQLKSGGAAMTVDEPSYSDFGNIRCVWLVDGEVKRDVFAYATLRTVHVSGLGSVWTKPIMYNQANAP